MAHLAHSAEFTLVGSTQIGTTCASVILKLLKNSSVPPGTGTLLVLIYFCYYVFLDTVQHAMMMRTARPVEPAGSDARS
jgi:hypothetical protein